MNASDISNINTANYILRHFVNLSARLLPMLHELKQKRNPSKQDISSIKKIIEVYKNYNFDTVTSVQLMNSNVLELIQTTFEKIIDASTSRQKVEKLAVLDHFLDEKERLNQNWNYIEAN